jgi:RHS repeat-associated protein
VGRVDQVGQEVVVVGHKEGVPDRIFGAEIGAERQSFELGGDVGARDAVGVEAGHQVDEERLGHGLGCQVLFAADAADVFGIAQVDLEDALEDRFGVVAQINGNTQTSRFEYDPLGRLKLRRDVNARGTNLDAITTFTYDGGGAPNPAAGQLFGQLTSTSSPDGVERTFFFNSQTRNLERTTQRVDGATFETRFEFDNVGRVDRIRYPAAATLPAVSVKNVFDDAGFLTAVRDGEAPDTAKPYWTFTDTDLHGQLAMETYGNGLRQSRTYDPYGRLDVTRTLPASGTPSSDVPIFALDIDYDPNGNVRSRNTTTRNQRETYAYDAHDRLTSDSFGNSAGRTFSYDAIGRRTTTSTLTYDPAHIHAIRTDGTFTYTYDAAGNRTRRATAAGVLKRFDYTFFGKPKAIWDELTPGRKSNEVTLRYDADMSRSVKTVLDPTTHAPKLVTTYMGGLYEQRAPKPSGNPEHVYYITNGSRVVAQISMLRGRTPDEVKKSYLHDDNLGSPRIISDGSAGFKEFDYDAFGTRRDPNWAITAPPANTTGVTMGFTAQETDDEHALINMKGRIYDPRTFQFITPDPFVQAPFSSTGLNRYAYVMHNPLTLVDPTGYYPRGVSKECSECSYFEDTPEPSPEPATEPEPTREPEPQEETKSEEATQSEEPTSDFGDELRSAGDVDFNDDAHSDLPGYGSGQDGPSIRAGEPLSYFSRYTDRATGQERLAPWEQGEPTAMDWFHYGGHEALNALEIGSFFVGGVLKGASSAGVITAEGTANAAKAALLRMQLAAEKVAGARLPQQIAGYRGHGIEQAIGREGVGVAARAMLDAFKNPLRIVGQSGGRFQMIGRDATIVINAEGKIITTWATNAAGIRVAP